jgi:signal transduction histidine kinase
MIRTIAHVLGLMLLCIAGTSSAVFYEPLVYQHRVPDGQVSYFIESGRALNIDSVIAQPDGWASRADKPFKPGGPAMAVWAKFPLPVSDGARQVLINASPWETVDYYIVSDGKVIETKHAGTLLPRSARSKPIPMITPISQAGFVAVDIPAHARYVLLARLGTATRYTTAPGLRFSLWDADEVQQDERADRDFQGIAFGMLLFMFLSNLALFLFNRREPGFLYYAISLVGFFGLWGPYSGLTFEFLWPEHPQWDYYSIWLGLPIAQAAFIQFVRFCLDTPRHFPKSDMFLKWAAAAALLVIPLVLVSLVFNYSLKADAPSTLSGLIALAVTPVGLAVIVRGVAMRLAAARIMLAAGVLGFIGALVPPLLDSDMIPSNPLTWNAPQIFTVLTGLMLSVWLGVRLRQAAAALAAREFAEERLRNAHELEKREMLERERSRIMSDMHDGVGGQLISVLSLLEQGDMPNTEVAKAIRECLDDLRLTIDSLEPTDHDLLPVLGNLRYRLDQRLKKHGINLNWTVSDLPKLACLTPRNILHILRILQEAFTNVLKHAHATAVGVETGVDTAGKHVFISIRDNGTGFAGEHAGHGLTSMKHRAQIIGGALDILPSPAGTTLRLLLPIS